MSVRLVIEQLRGGRFEAAHPVSAVLVDPAGRVVERVGDPLITTWRSAAKPFQLEVSLSLLAEDLAGGLDPRDLALGAASHSAQPAHVTRVRDLLARFGLSEDDLFCGAHWPIHVPSTHDLLRGGHEATAVHNNCSGKHTFMAAASRAHGWPRDYRDPQHPLQQRIRARIADLSGTSPEAVIDGCGVPCWVLPLSGMARAWAKLAAAMAGGEADGLGRIGWAMQRHPWFFSGDERGDGALVRDATRPLVCKVGAEGLMCGALPEEALGFALKVHSGHAEMRAVAAFVVLQRWFPDLVPMAAAAPWSVLRNVIGRPVGNRVAVWERGQTP